MKFIAALIMSPITLAARAYAVWMLWCVASEPFSLPVVSAWHIASALLIFSSLTVKIDETKEYPSWQKIFVRFSVHLLVSGWLSVLAVIIKSNI